MWARLIYFFKDSVLEVPCNEAQFISLIFQEYGIEEHVYALDFVVKVIQ